MVSIVIITCFFWILSLKLNIVTMSKHAKSSSDNTDSHSAFAASPGWKGGKSLRLVMSSACSTGWVLPRLPPRPRPHRYPRLPHLEILRKCVSVNSCDVKLSKC